jgi:hypothetical protein
MLAGATRGTRGSLIGPCRCVALPRRASRARSLALAVLAVLAVLAAGEARADVERYALLIGNNAGDHDEQRLRYAEDDARRVHEVLRELGGFRPENMLLLHGEDADTVRRALISLNDRIRTQSAGGSQTALLVYYSGHADQSALHLGSTALDLVQLQQLVRGSPAAFRMLILDACRSGALTRAKGGRIQPGFAIALDERIPAEGVVFWTASAETEDAQESDALRGSFFTHYLLSGLHGAADVDGDARVTVGEAYRHAYESTLRATSRTLSGTQHPTFRYELGGQREVVLATLNRPDEQRALVRFPAGKSYLLIRGNEDGAIVAEVGAHDRTRRLSVKPGRYFVRGRGRDFLLEGTLSLRAGVEHDVREDELDRIAYARLVRKGHDGVRHASSVHAGYALRTALWRGAGGCHGVFAGYAIDLRWVTLAPRLAACRGQFDNAFLRATTDELDLELRGSHVWDIGGVAVNVGIHLGGSLLRQDFSSEGLAPSRNALAAHLGVLAGTTVDLVQGFYGGIEVDAMTYFFQQQAMDTAETAAPFAMRVSVLLLGKRW